MSQTGRIVMSGLVSGAVYLAAQAIDLAFTGNNVDDRLLLGGVAPVPPGQVRKAGTVIHLLNSVLASIVYARIAAPRLKGPGWLRGVIFASIENVLLYPLVLLEGFHPAVRDGRLDS